MRTDKAKTRNPPNNILEIKTKIPLQKVHNLKHNESKHKIS